jgi:hypothetical protein
MRFQSRVLIVCVNLYSVQIMAFLSDHPFSKCSWINNNPSSCYRKTQTHQMSAVIKTSSKPKSKTIPAPVPTSSPTSVDYESINKLTFRELQRTCRDHGLGSTGSTATLRNRLLDFHGIALNTATSTNDVIPSSIPEEVRTSSTPLNCYTFLLYQQYHSFHLFSCFIKSISLHYMYSSVFQMISNIVTSLIQTLITRP